MKKNSGAQPHCLYAELATLMNARVRAFFGLLLLLAHINKCVDIIYFYLEMAKVQANCRHIININKKQA